jgi:uncharacterized membrane protein
MTISGLVSSVATNTAGGGPERAASRIASLDLVRGIAMVLMAIDHVRVYSGLPAGGPAPGIFFTRWITHFVAPTFVFLAGTALYLHGQKLRNRAALSKFLFTRGVWLILLELTVLRMAWTFNFDFAHYLLAGVIWMIGWCMVIMAALVHLPLMANAIGGIAIILLHNLTDVFRSNLVQAFGAAGPNWFLKVLYFGGAVELGNSGPTLFILFVIVPWIGLMMAGYAFGAVMQMPPDRRRRICLRLGLALSALFILLRTVDVYGDPRPWQLRPSTPAAQTSITSTPPEAAGSRQTPPRGANARPAPPRMSAPLRFLNTTKYPASLLFLLMTLGPMFVLIAFAESWRGRLAEIGKTFGRVPMFYYLLHIPLIHFVACMVSLIREGHVNAWLFTNLPVAPGPVPAGYAWPLWLLYLVYFVCVTVLYFPCRWYAQVRARRKSHWLSYL